MKPGKNNIIRNIDFMTGATFGGLAQDMKTNQQIPQQ